VGKKWLDVPVPSCGMDVSLSRDTGIGSIAFGHNAKAGRVVPRVFMMQCDIACARSGAKRGFRTVPIAHNRHIHSRAGKHSRPQERSD